jgi:hypothetical protein
MTKTDTVTKRAQEIAADLKAQDAADQERALIERATASAQAEADEAARLARLKEIEDRAPRDLDRSEVDKAYKSFCASLEKYVSTCAAYDARHREIAGLLQDSTLQPLPDGWSVKGFGSSELRVAGFEAERTKPQRDIAAAALKPLKEAYPRAGISLDNPQDL